jgi:AraC-like DNA-binding protein
MFRSRRTAAGPATFMGGTAAGDSDVKALEHVARELQIFAGELNCANPQRLTALLRPTLDAIPNAPAALPAWLIRAILANTLLRIDARFGSVPSRGPSDLEALWRADSTHAVRDILLRHVREIQHAQTHRDGAAGCGDSRIDKALDYIRAHCANPSLALSDVSDFVRMSRWHLSRLFTRRLGVGYRELVRELRMERATLLLNEDLLSVKEVAARLGFAHPTEFDRQFKQSFGMTPTQSRARHARPYVSAQPVTTLSH